MNKNVVPIGKVDKTIEEFFCEDGGITSNSLIRKSTLLACKRDFLFLRGGKFTQHPYNLSKSQNDAMQENLPSFAAILVYCSAIDLLARVMKRETPKNKSEKLFLWSARRWFGLTRTKSKALWQLRCSMSHQYMIAKNQRTVPFGTSGSMVYDKKYRTWVFNLNGMFGDIRKAISKSYEKVLTNSGKTKQKYANFVYEYGFYYIHNAY